MGNARIVGRTIADLKLDRLAADLESHRSLEDERGLLAGMDSWRPGAGCPGPEARLRDLERTLGRRRQKLVVDLGIGKRQPEPVALADDVRADVPVLEELERGRVEGDRGVGLSAIQGARLVSAHPVIVVDPVASKRELAVRLGATHTVDPATEDPVGAVRTLTGGGADYALEAIGRPEVVRQAFAATRQGGATVLVGQPAIGVDACFPVYDLTQFEHTVLGSNLGAATPALDVPALARLQVAGRLDLDTLVTHRFELARINEAIALVESGEAGRVVIELD